MAKIPQRVPQLRQHLKISIRQMATMVDAGTPLLRALEILASQRDSPALGQIFAAVTHSVQSGLSLSAALSRFPQAFAPTMVGLVKVAERTGQLSENLDRLAIMLEREESLIRRTRAALTYPALVLLVAAILGLLIFTTVLPQFLTVFRELNAPLPLPTRILMFLVKALNHPGFWLMLVGSGLLLGGEWNKFQRQPSRRLQVWGWLVKIPVLGSILRFSCVARYCCLLHGLVESGSNLTHSLRLAGGACGDPQIEADTPRLERELSHGASLAQAFRRAPNGLYPKALAAFLEVAEETNSVAPALARLERWFDEALATRLELMSALFEPLLMAGLALGVGGVILAIILPLYGILNQITG